GTTAFAARTAGPSDEVTARTSTRPIVICTDDGSPPMVAMACLAGPGRTDLMSWTACVILVVAGNRTLPAPFLTSPSLVIGTAVRSRPACGGFAMGCGSF